MSDDFYAQYKHPKWQKRSREVMERAGWKCEHCGTEEKTLHAHHRFYYPSRDRVKLWEYKDEDLVCLCEDCHERWHWRSARIKKMIGKLDEEGLDSMASFIRSKEDEAKRQRQIDAVDPFAKLGREYQEAWHDELIERLYRAFGLPMPVKPDPWREDGFTLF